MIIDSHLHLWSDDEQRYPFATGSRPSIPGSVELLNETMGQAGVGKAVIVNPILYLYDNRYVADCLRRFPGKFAAVCLVNPEEPDAPDRLERLVKVDGLGGMRLHFSRQENPWVLAEEDQYPLWQRVQDLGVAFIALMKSPEQLPALENMVERFPGVKVVVDHMAFPDVQENHPYPIFSNLLRLARYPNVFVKVSNMPVVSRQPYPHPDTFPFVRLLYDAFGPQRLMWGSDWPLITNHCTYSKALELVRDHLDFLTEEDKQWLFSKTVSRVWPFAPTPQH